VKHINIKQPYPRFLENKTRMTIKGKRYRIGNKNHPFNFLYEQRGIYAVFAAMGLLHFPTEIYRINKRVKELFDEVEDGYVYIISNPCWDGWFKVGMAVDPEDRCNSYQTSSPFRDYKLCYNKYFKDRRSAEKTAHKKLRKKSIKYKGEWFKVSIKEAIKTIEKL
jgi:hypothetical protein